MPQALKGLSVTMSDPLRPYLHSSPYLEVYVIGSRINFALSELFNFLLLTGMPLDHPFAIKVYPYVCESTREFLLNLDTPFGKAIKRAPLLLRIHAAYHFIAQTTIIHKSYQTPSRIRKRLLRSPHFSFFPRFHKPSSNPLQNLIRFRLKPRITSRLPISPLPHPHKTYIQFRYIIYPPLTIYSPPKTSVSGFDPPSRYPREGVG
jgi:hypothetical protein